MSVQWANTLLALALLSCSSREHPVHEDDAHDAALRYRLALASFAVLEASALDPVRAATGATFSDDATLLAVVRVSLGKYRDFLSKLEVLKVEREDLRGFQGQVVAVSRKELALLERLEKALAHHDGTAVLFLNVEQAKVRAEGDALFARFAPSVARVEAR